MTGLVVAPMALLGSGEFEPWASDGERLLLSLAAGDGSVAVLPLAAAPEGETYADWAHKGLTHFEEFGIPPAWSRSRSAVTPSRRSCSPSSHG